MKYLTTKRKNILFVVRYLTMYFQKKSTIHHIIKKGITFSAFDLLQVGHVKMLKDAKRQCDYLTHAIRIDPT
jgi:bifunctional ADP-heptose synthase (sugar kinase/adenylyltransferase)